MKKILFSFSAIPLVVALLGWGFGSKEKADFSFYYTGETELYYDVPLENSVDFSFKITYYPVLGKGYVGFCEALGFKESRGNYFVVNDFGYMGKYQFGKSTLRQIGVYNHQEFLKNPKLQETALSVYLARNKWELRKYIHTYSNKHINGVYVTESGILAAAHLAGPGNVKRFLRSSGVDNFTDGFGTSIHYYLRKFSGYDTSHIKPNRNAKVKA